MRRIRGLSEVRPERFRRPVATLGVFDGVHRGHAAVIAATRKLAEECDGESVVVTFDIHPRVVVSGEGPGRINTPEHRLRLLERHGLDTAVILHFDDRLRDRTAESFLKEVLVDGMGITGLVLGPDSHYGRDRGGNAEVARSVLEPLGIAVVSVDPVDFGDGVVSSTAIRDAVRAGHMEEASSMLGRPVSVLGAVVRGDGRGREMGIPTANLDLAHEIRPPRGVYGVRVRLPDGSEPWALANIGGRPTFKPEGEEEDSLEVWIPDWEGDLYGETIEIEFLVRLRDEMKFDGAETLRRQIDCDRAAMVEWLRRDSLGDRGANA
ncbi:MAG: riboflavin biosynthesis protein RibF [Planctomycetota bacterium]|jgi:riboflavin kinase/FMN adenylyltransferase